MQVARHRWIAGIVVGIVLLCVLVVFISPYVTAPRTHLRASRAPSHQMGRFALRSATAIGIQAITIESPTMIELQQFVSTAPILPLICIRLC
jgi:hypothetical protein